MTVMLLYKTRRAFNSFDNKDYTVFIYEWNPIYKVRNAWLFSRLLFNEVYDDMYRQVQIVIDKYIYFNFVKDGLAKTSYNYIINLFVHIKIDIFQLKSVVISFIKYNFEELVQ